MKSQKEKEGKQKRKCNAVKGIALFTLCRRNLAQCLTQSEYEVCTSVAVAWPDVLQCLYTVVVNFYGCK